MQTILGFINLILTLFNCTLSIFIFCLADELEYKPEKAYELSETMGTFFPVELGLHSFITFYSILNRNWIQMMICIPMFIYNLKFFLTKKHKLHYLIGDNKEEHRNFSFTYKNKFVYYCVLTLFNLIKFIISMTNMLAYNLFGDTNLLFHIIKLIGLY